MEKWKTFVDAGDCGSGSGMSIEKDKKWRDILSRRECRITMNVVHAPCNVPDARYCPVCEMERQSWGMDDDRCNLCCWDALETEATAEAGIFDE